MAVCPARRRSELADGCGQIAASILEMGLQPAVRPLAEKFEQEANILDRADALCVKIDWLPCFLWHRPSPLRRFPSLSI